MRDPFQHEAFTVINRKAVSPRRYQARISFDDRMGDLWNWLEALPERSRPSKLLFMMQLGFETHRTLAAHATTAMLGLKMPGGAIAVPAGRDKAESSAPAAESPQAAMEATLDLGGWNMEAFSDVAAMGPD